MNDMKKNIRRVFWFYFLLFALLIVYLGKFVLLDSNSIIVNTYNPRLSLISKNIRRGDVLDRNGERLAATENIGSGYERTYPYGESFSHVVGYADPGKAGVEAAYNFELEKADQEVLQRIFNLQGREIKGNSIVLSLDAPLQEYAYNKLKGQKGAIVIMEPSTGKILAMVSFPAFDPNTLSQNWDTIREDTINSPLLNRATQGLYPPGSVFKILTAASEIEYLPDHVNLDHNCEGVEKFGDDQIQCYDAKAHGTVNLDSAFALSCNTYFATVGIGVTAKNMKNVANRMLFNTGYDYPLEYRYSSFPMLDDATQMELIQTSIGQGRTLVTPLHMAMITSAVANGGIMMKPYVVDHIENYAGVEKGKRLPKMLGEVFSSDEAESIRKMMIKVVQDGTGTRAAPDGIIAAGKTGSAQNAVGDDHGWFVGFAPADAPKIAVCIIIENCGGSINVLPIAKELMQYALAE